MIEHVKLRGSIGIKRGLGLDEIEVGFRGREGMIALDGKNGAGKSSFLECGLQPYDCIVSREGALKNHFMLRDSLKELTFTHGGHHYKTVLKIDSESGRSEGFVYIDGSTASATGGKISEYHKWALQTFGSPELFFASLFCSQNSRKLSDMRVGELKGLFVEFLRLERYEAWADTSKQAGNILQGKVEAIEQRIAALLETAGKRDETDLAYGAYADKLEFLRDDKTLLQHTAVIKKEEAEFLKAIIAQNTLARERIADIQKQIDRQKEDLAKEKAASDQDIATLTARWKELKIQIGKAETILAHKSQIEGAAEEEKTTQAHLETILEQEDQLKDQLSEAKEKAHGLETQITALRQQVKDLGDDAIYRAIDKKVQDAEAGAKAVERDIAALEHDQELSRLKADLSGLERAAKVGDGIDATCQSVTCAAIKSVNEAKEKLPAADAAVLYREQQIAEKREFLTNQLLDIQAAIDAIMSERDERCQYLTRVTAEVNKQISTATHDLRNVQTVTLNGDSLIKKAQADIAKDRATLATLKSLSARLPEITIAEQRKTDLSRQLAEVEKNGADKREVWELRAKEADDRLQFSLGAKAAYKIDEEAEVSLSVVHKEIIEIEGVKIPAIDNEIQKAREKVTTLRAELTRIEEAEKELEKVRAERESLASQVARWRYLQNVCGKNGLQALEIDGAAPLIASRANELLMQGYGPQYTVRIDTQDEQGREDLGIKVLSEWGTDSLKDKSGGEKIWLLHPIRLAMALLSKEKSGRDFDVAMMDEIDGPLDREGAATNFMEMYRPFMKLGGIRQLFYITHREACLSYADHVLRFEVGKNPAWG